jgi:beta-lactamase superfamily II metal-dependent hydrolase
LEIHFLPARFGDAIIVDYETDGRTLRFLIDGGTKGTRHDIRKVLRDGLTDLELVVVSHIDRDHIEGLLAMLEEANAGFDTRDFWFNAWNHLPKAGDETFGAEQGERLSRALREKNVPWNTDFGRNAVKVPDAGALPVIDLDGDMKLTLLGPTHQNLLELAPKWEKEVRDANLDPEFGLEASDEEPEPGPESFDAIDIPDVTALANTPFTDDDSEANRSSIAFIAEHDGKRVLFAGDACVETLLAGLERFAPGAVVKLDLVKIPHHGSPRNISKELIGRIDCPRWMFSSNGSIFKHPSKEAVARVIEFVDRPEIIFNYRSDENAIWRETAVQKLHGYTILCPDAGKKGISITL